MAKAARSNFYWMGLLFAICHGCVTTPLIYSTSVLGSHTGLVGNALLYLATVVSSLLVSVTVTAFLGSKFCLGAGMVFYGFYVLSFSVSGFLLEKLPDATLFGLSHLPSIIFYAGSVCGGIGAGLLWTGQGDYFSRAADIVSKEESLPRESASTELGGQFATYYLAFEVGSKAAFALLQTAGLQAWLAGFIFTGISFASWVLLLPLDPLRKEDASSQPRGDPLAKVLSALRLWPNPRLWLLSPINCAFGLSAAYVTGPFNADKAAQALGQNWIGFMGAFTVICATLMVQVFNQNSQKVGKGSSLGYGGLCLSAACALAFLSRTSWGFGLVGVYVLQGSGRAVYESTNKALVSDVFKGADAAGAFANCMVQFCLAAALGNFLCDQNVDETVVILAAAFGISAVPGYCLAVYLPRNREEEPLVPRTTA